DREQVASASIAATAPSLDLAVLKVVGLELPPKPIDLRTQSALVETMPVFILGYPLGQVLSAGRSHPAVTVGRGTISSLRRDPDGRLVAVQLDGDVNPGNSGGPVVDGKGRLVGLAAARVRDTHIGLALPAGTIEWMLQGQPLSVRFTPKVENDTTMKLTVEV